MENRHATYKNNMETPNLHTIHGKHVFENHERVFENNSRKLLLLTQYIFYIPSCILSYE